MSLLQVYLYTLLTSYANAQTNVVIQGQTHGIAPKVNVMYDDAFQDLFSHNDMSRAYHCHIN